jgi:hypothetical protein
MYHNDPELDRKLLGFISSDFVKVADHIREASYQIRKRGFSPYPVFPMSRQEIPIGKLLIPAGEIDENSWYYYATYVDEFLQRKLIEEEKLSAFVDTYKDPDEFCCLFVVEPDFTNFLFIPYPED